MKNDKTALGALDRLRARAVYYSSKTSNALKVLEGCINDDAAIVKAALTRPQPCGDAVKALDDLDKLQNCGDWLAQGVTMDTAHTYIQTIRATLSQAQTVDWEVITDALESAQNGLEWYRTEYPDDTNGSDNEMDEKINKALEEIRKV